MHYTQWVKAMVEQTSEEQVRTELDLAGATFKLRDLSQAACLNGHLPYLVGQLPEEAQALLEKPPTLFSTDGTAAAADICYQPPEVSCPVLMPAAVRRVEKVQCSSLDVWSACVQAVRLYQHGVWNNEPAWGGGDIWGGRVRTCDVLAPRWWQVNPT